MTNLAAKLLGPAAAAPERPALWWRDETVGAGELSARARGFATGLAALGVGPGDRVAIVCANTPTFVVSYLGALVAGAVAVPVNPGSVPRELAGELAASEAAVVVVGPAGRRPLAAAREWVSTGDSVVVTAGVAAGSAAASAAGSGDLGETVAWDELVGREPSEIVERSGDDVAVLVHTSGTSGAPKAAMLTHANLAANIDQAQGHPTVAVEPDDVVLGVLPLFHSYGLTAVLGLSLAAGAGVALAETFHPHETLELVARRRVTVVAGVPPMFAAWSALPDAPGDAFDTLRVAVSGAAPLEPAVQRGFRDRFGVALHQGYGLTEASPIVTTTVSEREPREGSIGVPLPGVEVRLVDRQGGTALVGDPGEIQVRGDNVFPGYWNDEEASAAVLTEDGWLRTGDLAVADDDGFLSIVGRSKDLVIVSGFNVYPVEVEEVLVRHGGVAEAAVVGVPDAHTGESVKAYVVPDAGAQLDEEELVGWCRDQLARYKCPAAVEVVRELPRGLAGKVLRRSLGDLP